MLLLFLFQQSLRGGFQQSQWLEERYHVLSNIPDETHRQQAFYPALIAIRPYYH